MPVWRGDHQAGQAWKSGRTGTRPSNDAFTTPHFEFSALLVIDTQVDFLDEGVNPITGTSDRLPEMTRLVETYRSTGRPIVHVDQAVRGKRCRPGPPRCHPGWGPDRAARIDRRAWCR
jgi:nicotinamidase-related amidase